MCGICERHGRCLLRYSGLTAALHTAVRDVEMPLVQTLHNSLFRIILRMQLNFLKLILDVSIETIMQITSSIFIP